MRPIERKRDASWPTDILFADSVVPFWGENKEGIYGRWYRTAFAYNRDDEMWTASFHEYPASEFDLVSSEAGKKQRLNEAEIAALANLMLLNDSGIFDESRKADFAKI